MGLYRRKDSKQWWMSFTVNGRQYSKSTGTADKQTAQKIYDIVKAKIALGQWAPELQEKKPYTFTELVDKFREWAKGRMRSYDKDRKYVVNLLLEKFKDLYLDDFTAHTIEKLQSEFLEKGYSVAYINKITGLLKSMFSKAVDWDMVDEGILKKIRKAKQLKGENKRLRYLTKAECEALIDACDPHLKPIVITALNTGMRKSEILNLKWKNVDLQNGFILLDKTKNDERREIPINETLRAVLKTIPRRLDIPYVFYNPKTGKPYHKDLKRSFKTALKRTKVLKCSECTYQEAFKQNKDTCPVCNSKMILQKGIEDFRFHDLRHTFASHLVMAGVDLTTVKELLGHKDIKMTLRYAHLAPSHKTEAIQKFDAYLNKKIPHLKVQTG